MNKKDAEFLQTHVIALLLSSGFVATPDKMYSYHAEGQKGPVDVSVRSDKRYKRRGYDVSIFGVFADPTKARDMGANCNPYSGKHNFLNMYSIQAEYYISQYL